MRYFIVILLIFTQLKMFATHNRAGEITYKQISALTYEVTVTTFTYSLSNADRPELEVAWGDNSLTIVSRVQEILLPNNYQKNVYIGQHTYPGPGTFVIVVEDPNRNYGVNNIPNSVNVVFSIKTILQINPEIGFNNTPILLNPPIDKAAKGRLFIHNPAAYDPDGDSISYKLGICTGENGQEIQGYTLPLASNSISIDEITGDLIWDVPIITGIYNVAIVIEEWRYNKKIGKIVRDMQIEVIESNNHPPIITTAKKICVGVDTTITFPVNATDVDNDNITLIGTGGPLYLANSPAEFSQPVIGHGSVSSNFLWNTKCSHVRKQNYQVTFKATDDYYDLNLVDLKNVLINVIGPAPENLTLEPASNYIKLNWNRNYCTEAVGYYIYRKVSPSGFIPDTCEIGVPSYTGYERIAKLNGYNDTTYIDNNNGSGLLQGYEYCYMVTSFWDDGAEGYASDEVCSPLVRGIPVITNVSINYTDVTNGSVYLAWAKPIEFDSINAPGPYKYLIYRSNDLWGNNLQLIDSLSGINDTLFTDTLLNTKDTPISYKVEFYNDESGNRFLIGAPQVASSVYLKTYPDDNSLTLKFEKNIPWINDFYIVYKLNALTSSFDSIGVTYTEEFIDDSLKNGDSYCYKVESSGGYKVNNIINPILNFSQEQCGIPKDTTSPCQPCVYAISNCDSAYHQLSWSNPNIICSNDIIKYNIYYKSTLNGNYELIFTTQNNTDTTFKYYPKASMAGCYLVSAVDSFANESQLVLNFCIDNCSYYELPNVFSPDGDGKNDYFRPGPYKFVEKIDLKIFNRWGVLVFQTDDPDINWNGNYIENNKPVTDGVYYYICDVYEQRLTGLEPLTLLGFIHVFNNKQKTTE